MKKLLLILLSLFSAFFVFVKDTNAQFNCGTLTINASSVPRMGGVTIQLAGATGFANQDLFVRAYDKNGNFINNGEVALRIRSDGTGAANLFAGVFTDPGNYTIAVFATPIQDVNDTTPSCSNAATIAVEGASPTGPLKNPVEEQKEAKGIEVILCEARTGIRTALGCIPFNSLTEFISRVLLVSIGLVGGTAFLVILYSAFLIITSAGDKQKLKSGQELLNAAIAGTLMLIFSVFLLRIIGVNILGVL